MVEIREEDIGLNPSVCVYRAKRALYTPPSLSSRAHDVERGTRLFLLTYLSGFGQGSKASGKGDTSLCKKQKFRRRNSIKVMATHKGYSDARCDELNSQVPHRFAARDDRGWGSKGARFARYNYIYTASLSLEMNVTLNKISTEKIALLVFVCAVPILGGIVGLILVISGIVRKIRIYIIIGLSGIAITMTLGLVLEYKTTHRGSFDETRRIVATSDLGKIMRALEFYKVNYSYYPKMLEEVKVIDNTINFFDPLQQVNPGEDQTYYYKQVDSSYYLFSRGFDAKPFTSDDLLPDISGLNPGKIGLRLQ